MSRRKFDVTTNKRSISGMIEPMFARMDDMSYGEIVSEFLEILNDPTVHASEKTRQIWRDSINNSKDKTGLIKTMANLYCKAAGLGLND